MNILLVGGAVRDEVMGHEPKDRDYVVIGSTPDEMISLGYSQVGADFPVFLHPVTNDEYALARTERKSGVGYHGFEVDFSSDIKIEDDLLRRDLTINSMAMHLDTREIVDPFGGRRDINEGVLRHTSGAFRDDPVRVLRIARFAARFPTFGIHQHTGDLIEEMIANCELDHLTPERIYAEFEKGLMEVDPARMINTLHHLGAFSPIKGFTTRAANLDALTLAAEANEPLAIRFSLVKTEKNTELDARLPAHIKELSEVVTARNFDFGTYVSLSAEERVNFLSTLDAFRKTERFDNFCKASSYLMAARGYDGLAECVNAAITGDLQKIADIDQGAIAKSCINKKMIGEAIRNARTTCVYERLTNPR